MTPSLPSLNAPNLSESQKTALITLLSDEDLAVYRAVRKKVLSLGESAQSWLKPYRLSDDPVLRRRVNEILEFQGRQLMDNRFLAFCLSQGEDFSLEEATWLLGQTRYPEINVQGYKALLDSYAGDLKDLINFGSPPEQILGAINDYLFDSRGFQGNEENYYEADNSYLNRVIDRKIGNPISLCLIYLFLARRLRLPITGIGMPGHFVCRFQSSTKEIYIDAYNRGKLLSKADCIKYLLHTSHGFQESFLAPVTPRRILLRMCSNLHQIYSRLALPDEVARLQRCIVALAK